MTRAGVIEPHEEHESVVDPRVWQLLRRYVELSGAAFLELGPHLYQITVPASDRAAFARRSVIRLAFSAEALREDGNAEMAIVGSAFVNQLIEASRLRGARWLVGRVIPSGAAAGAPDLPYAIRNGQVVDQVTRTMRHRVGRMTARIVIRAGADVKEHLAESALFDLCTGVTLGQDLIDACDAVARAVSAQPTDDPWIGTQVAEVRAVDELVSRMLGSLERSLRPDIELLNVSAARALTQELERINKYYTSLLDDVGSRSSEVVDSATRRTFEAEHGRRAREETERHKVRAVVHPVQLAEWEVLVQRADWTIQSNTDHRGQFTAQRVLAGANAWVSTCPTCERVPSALVVCAGNHVACPDCSHTCSVCDSGFCEKHGVAACHVDGRPSCVEHARTCRSCRRGHCSAHEGICDESGHKACTACLVPCVHCGRVICDKHATMSHADAPRGSRRLCDSCVRTCEGGTGEIVGPDEVTGCASCARVVCERHQARCAVDGLVHCSTHLRRADRSRRLVCEKHRAGCIHEPNAVLAADEVARCVTCGGMACQTHAAGCVTDGAVHCTSHLVAARDVPGAMVCESHRTVCHVDGGVFSQAGTAPCVCCGRLHCRTHRKTCGNCGRVVCSADVRAGSRTCATCGKLAETPGLSDAVHAAAAAARGDDSAKVKHWRASRDARHVVVEMDLGWTRRLVISVPHGDSQAEQIVSHSLLGSKVRRA